VLGGAGLALFGTVAASGIRTLSKVDFSGNANLVIVAFTLAAGIIPIAVPTFYDKFPEWFQVIFDSGITAAAIVAVLLNIVFNIIGRKESAEAPIFAEGPAIAAISDEEEARLDPSSTSGTPDEGQGHLTADDRPVGRRGDSSGTSSATGRASGSTPTEPEPPTPTGQA